MSLSNWFENKVLNHIFSKGSYTPQILYVGLCTANPGEGGTGGSCNEVSNSNGYARKQTSSAYWNASSGGQLTNSLALVFPEAQPGGWGTITHFAIFNSGTYGVGDMLMYGALSQSKATEEGSLPRFDPGELVVTLD